MAEYECQYNDIGQLMDSMSGYADFIQKNAIFRNIKLDSPIYGTSLSFLDPAMKPVEKRDSIEMSKMTIANSTLYQRSSQERW